MKTVLLTGATGFLGSHLLGMLLEEGYSVLIIKRSTSDTWRINHLLNQVKAYDADTTPLETVFDNQKIDFVVHTACSYGRNSQLKHKVVETNILFGLHLLDLAVANGIRAFLNTDTFFNNGGPSRQYLSSYTLSKKQFLEWLVQSSSSVQTVNMKLQHLYGPKDGESKFIPWVITQFRKQVARISFTEGRQLRDFTYVDDVARAYLTVLDSIETLPLYSEFVVGTGSRTSVRDLVEIMRDRYVEQQGTKVGVLGFGDLPYQDGEIMNVETDNAALLRLGWSPEVTLCDGIRKTIEAELL